MKRFSRISVFYVGLVFLLSSTVLSNDEIVDQISTNLMCTCSCPHVIKHCGDECGVAPQLVQRITGLIASGKTEDQVYEVFEESFGPSVHAVPKPEGFNLLAWILPCVALCVGIVVVIVVFKKLNLKTPDKKLTEVEINQKYRKLLDKELEK